MPVKSYKGNEKYIFISYAHKDRDIVLPELNLLQEYGCRFWYDEGIEAGEDWAGRIGSSLDGASAVLLFASAYALKRENVLREIKYALGNKLPVLVVKLDNKHFPEEMQRSLLTNQIVEINRVSTYGELTNKLLPALKSYGVMEEATDEKTAKETLAQVHVSASQRIKHNSRSKTKKKAYAIAGIVAGLILIAVIVRIVLFSSVPDVVGLEVSEAQDLVTEAGMNSQVSLDYSPDYEYGVIFKQSAEGTIFKFIPVVLSQSLGPNENLTTVPDVVGNHLSEGAIALAACGMTKFTIHPETNSNQQVENISAQSIPAGLRVSKDSRITLDVKSNGEDISFFYNGELITISGTKDSDLDISLINESEEAENETEEITGLDINNPDTFGLTEAEWQLFYANNQHTTDEDGQWENVWLPAATEEMIIDNPGNSYGWVAVRDMELDAGKLFDGYKELYVCPGVTVTIKGNDIGTDTLHDFYVADGGTLIFNDGLRDYARICNDGRTVMNGSFDTAAAASTVYNRGSFETAGSYNGNITFLSFGGGSHTGEDRTTEGIYDFGLFSNEYYEGVSGSKGMVQLTDGFKKYDALLEVATVHSYASEDPRYDNVGNYKAACGSCYYPVFSADQLSAHAADARFCFGFVILNDMECREDWRTASPVRQGYVEIIVAPGVTLVYPETLTGHRYDICILEGGKFVVNGVLNGKPAAGDCDVNIANAGTLEVNGVIDGSYNYWGFSSIVNSGQITGNGTITGSNMDILTLKGSSCTIDLSTCRSVNHADYYPNFYYMNNGPDSRWEYINECYDKHRDDVDKTAYIREALRRGLIKE